MDTIYPKNPSNNLYTLIERDAVEAHIKPLSEGKPKDTHSTPKPDTVERSYKDLTCSERIAFCTEVAQGYPREHNQYAKIESQIEGLKAKL